LENSLILLPYKQLKNLTMAAFGTDDKLPEPVVINNEIKSYLLETAKWARFISIIGFIGIGLILLAGVFISFAGSSLSNIPNLPFNFGFFGVIYFALGVLYFFPTYYLYKFSIGIKEGLADDEQSAFTTGFGYLKSTFKFLGILIIVLISLYVLVIIGVVIGVSIFSHR